jgi:gas vesicle structural protein
MAEFLSSPDDEMSLADLVNRVLDRGAVISGDVVISVGGVDLIYLGLRLVLASAETMREHSTPERSDQRAP